MKNYFLLTLALFLTLSLLAQMDESIKTFSIHKEAITSVVFSADDQYGLSGSYDYTMKLWDINSGQQINSYASHSDLIQKVCFDKSGKLALSASFDGVVNVWDINSGKVIVTFSNLDKVVDASFTPDGQFIIAACEDRFPRLLNIKTGKTIKMDKGTGQGFGGHLDVVWAIAISPNGKNFVSGSRDKTIKLWDIETGTVIRDFTGHTDAVRDLAFSPDGKSILSGSFDKTVKLWNTQTGEVIHNFVADSYGVMSVAFSPDGKYAVSGSFDNSIKLWDLKTGLQVHIFSGNTDDVFSVTFSHNGKFLLSGSKDGKIKLWDVSAYVFLNLTPKQKIEHYVNMRLQEWQTKGEFEKTVDYTTRVNEESRKKNIAKWQQEKTNELKIEENKNYSIRYFTLKQYDADNETYLLSGVGRNYVLHIPYASAPAFKQNFSSGKISGHDYILTNDGFKLSAFSITVPQVGTYTWSHATDNPYQQTAINYNFDKVDINIPVAENVSAQKGIEIKQITVGKSDVDLNIVTTTRSRPNTYALIIGNEDYTTYQQGLDNEANVPYAANDAEIFARYCEKTLGIPQTNITLIKNATLAQTNQAISKLQKLAEISKGSAELLFYYAGHGLPDEVTKEPYLIPVDVNGSNVTGGIALNDLYSRLGKFTTKKVTVFLDACFSGGSREASLVALRSVKVVPKASATADNMVVFTSSNGTESSAAYKEKGHGMFTYYLLKKLAETKGEATYKELGDYLQQQVQRQSVLINSKEQTPQVKYGSAVTGVWEGWRF